MNFIPTVIGARVLPPTPRVTVPGPLASTIVECIPPSLSASRQAHSIKGGGRLGENGWVQMVGSTPVRDGPAANLVR